MAATKTAEFRCYATLLFADLCNYTALIESVARFFGTSDVAWTLTTSKVAVPRVEQTSRTYQDLETLKREIFDARVWGGLHWRFSTTAGSEIGEGVAEHVSKHFFQPRK